jgi:hypothetical protein
MKRITFAAAIIIALATHANADIIKPNDIRATSQFGVGGNIENLVNGDGGPAVGLDPNGPSVAGLTHFGLIAAGGPGVLDDVHGISLGGAMSVAQWGWITGCGDAGIAGGDPGSCANIFAVEPVDEQIIEFEFDGSYDLSAVHIWNENGEIFAADRGVDEFEIEVSPDRIGDTFTAIGTTYNLTADDGFSTNSAQVVSLVASGVRRVRLLINSNHNPGVEDYVGLSEVRFEGTLVTQDLVADADKDGDVDGNDLLRWQRSLGLGEIDNFDVNGSNTFNSTLTATQSEGDYDNNNVVNGDDLVVWASEFGQPPPLHGSLLAVPEPCTALLGICAALGRWVTCRSRHHARS